MDESGASGPALERARLVFEEFGNEGPGGSGGSDGPGELLSPDFLIRLASGRVLNGDDGLTALREGPELSGLRQAFAHGSVRDIGDGYLLVVPPPAPPGPSKALPAWLMVAPGGRFTAVFGFDDRRAAIDALPDRLKPRSDVQVIEDSIWAFSRNDYGAVLRLLAPGYAYYDHVSGLELQGAAEALRSLLAIHDKYPGYELGHFAIERPPGPCVMVSGTATTDAPPRPGAGRWAILTCVEDDRVRLTRRFLDREAALEWLAEKRNADA